MRPAERLPLVLSLLLAVAITGVLFARQRGPAAPRDPVSADDAAAAAHAAAGVQVDGVGPVAPGFETRLSEARLLLAAEPDDLDRILDVARLLHDGHRPGEAVPLYQRALELEPSRVEALYDLAAAHAASGDWERATAVLKARVETHPDDGLALYDLGAIRANAGDPSGARVWFERATAQASDRAIRDRARAALERLGPGGDA